MPRAIVTCGPSYAPIDSVRRITNAATGEIGVALSDSLAARGFEVVCLRGEGSTAPPPSSARVVAFSTNGSLLEKLEVLAGSAEAVFHAAALCDFEPEEVSSRGKIPTSEGAITLRLHPAVKILPRLPKLFPGAFIAGWKFEVDGSREDALAKGRAQIAACGTSACAVNGPAFGRGFGLLFPQPEWREIGSKTDLAEALAEIAAKR